MNELQVFTNPEFGQVRTVTIEEEPWFVGKDVAVALGYESPRAAVSKKVDPEDKGVSEMETPSGKQQMTIINESGLYALIFGSKLESAKRFKHWVTHEVLPAIRKTGSYSIIPKVRALTTDDYMKAAPRPTTTAPKAATYTVKSGDCLWNIAKKQLGNGADYTKIYNLNKDKIKNPNLIYPGQVLTLPS